MSSTEEFRARYAAALRSYLLARGEASLAIGHELGRQALQDRISVLEITENHFSLVEKFAKTSRLDGAAALEFLLQTLAPLDIATRGFLDGTKRYEQQRARAKDLADRDEFRTALVNSLQEGFFVCDHNGVIVEVNEAFGQITGYPAADAPYEWPHPWVFDNKAASERLSQLRRDGTVQYDTPIRHRNGHIAWIAVSINAVTEHGADRDAFVGTIRDITAVRAAAARERAVVRLATAVSVAKDVAEVLSITLDECRTAIDFRRVVAVMWPPGDGDPTIHVAGEPAESSWRDLDPCLRDALADERYRLPLTVKPIGYPEDQDTTRGIVAVVPGAGDVTLWFEHRVPRRISAEDRLLVTALVGHLSLAMQHVRQFETARETSLTLQRAMLPPMETPAGFAVRYEPAVPPLEIGGDWYDVLSVDEHRIGIIVGDCVGRGLPAAAVMGQLRSSARALLLTGAEPAMLLEQLDSVATLIPDAFCTTVFAAILDSESGTLRYSSGGHVPAVVATPDAAPTVLIGAQSVPLAVHGDNPRPQATHTLAPGSTLFVYTDGLVERRDEPIDNVIAQVAAVVTDTMRLPVDAVADVVIGELAPPAGYDDDVAIVVYRRPPAPLQIEEAASAQRLADVRHRLLAWLQAAAIPEQLTADIVLAVYEACSNSVEHAYREGHRGNMRVHAGVTGSNVHVTVIDSGCWKQPDADARMRGRGLPLIRAVCDRADLNATNSGTTVDMSFLLPSQRHPEGGE